MLFLVLFLTTVLGVNWAFCRSLFQESVSLPDSLSTHSAKTPTHNASGG